ncbi:permease [Pseudarthrobacter sp. J1738]|uniref:permease n=1 Tax=unclassified Pseudarthrobacter TaxID=2647000 RepID=UPI003D2C30B0
MTSSNDSSATPLAHGSSLVGLIGLLGLTLLVGGSYLAAPAHTVAVAVVAALIGLGWPHFLGIPARKTLGAVLGLSAVASVVTAAMTKAPGFLEWTPAFIALGCMAVMLVQLIRGTGQAARLESTLGACAGVMLAALSAGWIANTRYNGVSEMVLVAGISAAVALLVGMIRWPDRIVAPLGVVMAALAAPLSGLVFSDLAVVPAAVTGVVVASVLMSFRRLVSLHRGSLSVMAAIGVGLAPVAAVGALAYFIDKLLTV